MNAIVYELFHLVSSCFNTTVNEADDYVWFEINNDEHLLVTLIDEGNQIYNDGLIINIALGIVDENFSTEILINLLKSNINLSVMNGPRFSYTSKTNMLVLMDKIQITSMRASEICSLIKDAIDIACKTKQGIKKSGYELRLEL
ncbi:type III secretion system chaperone [Enterobacter hormaechei]|nr:type III secretion system chaperone [Enterobacter hormaechei]